MTRKIAFLAIPGVQMLDLAGPMDVFSEANTVLDDPNAYVMKVIALEEGPVVAQNGMLFLADATIDTPPEEFDTLLVAGAAGIRNYEAHPDLVAWITANSKRVRRLGSICTGAFLLAHAGLLNGRRATTHWHSSDRLASMFGEIEVDPNPIYIKDGSTYTTAGVTASMDLALALVEEDHGRTVALRVAKRLILFLKRPANQSQFSIHLETQVSELGPIREIHEWILDNLGGDLSIEALASRAAMSARNFARIFKKQVGMTPAEYVEKLRVESARRIIEESDTPLKKVATMCGFSDQSALRRAFMRQINVTPVEYRHTFCPVSQSNVIDLADQAARRAKGKLETSKTAAVQP